MRIALIGAGNLATQLGLALAEKGQKIVQVFSQTEINASLLAVKLNCPYTCNLLEIVSDADIYILAVKDSAIQSILEIAGFGDHLVLHTAGSVPSSVFEPWCKNYGVLYPLQTFSKSKKVDFQSIPLLIEANNSQNLEMLKDLAGSISPKVIVADSEKRSQVHLAAVFACNFVNHFYYIAEELLKEKDLDFGILKPLISETASKVMESSPAKVQTGPAVRDDKKVMDEHLRMLESNPEWERLYQLISDNIIKTHKS